MDSSMATHTYLVHHRSDYNFVIVLQGLAGGVFLALGSFILLTELSVKGLIFGGICAALGASALGWTIRWAWWLPKQAWVIQVADAGTVTLVPRRGEPQIIHVDEIDRIHIGFTRDAEGDMWGQLELYDRAGPVSTIDYFAQAQPFVTRLRAMNPHIAVTGQWPSRLRS
jgi:hypothetical protein